MYKSQAGFTPLVVIFLIALVTVAGIVVKNSSLDKPQQPQLSPSPIASTSAQATSPTPTPTPILTKVNSKTTASPSPKAKPSTNPSPTSSPSTSSSNNSPNSQTNNPTTTTNSVSPASPAPTPTTIPTPSSTPAPLKTYTWNGTNINATTKCATGDSTFDIEVSGDVKAANSNDGVWTTLTGNGQTIIVSYDAGNYPSTTHIAFNFNDQVGSIRPGGPMTLQTSGSTTYSYEIKAYSSPFTNGTPSLSNQIGNVSFATDCK